MKPIPILGLHLYTHMIIRLAYYIVLILILALCGCTTLPAPPPASISPTAAVAATSTAAPRKPMEDGILTAMASYEAIIRDGQTIGIADLTDSAPIRRFLTSAAGAAPPSEGAAHRSYQIAATSEPILGIIEAELARDDGRHLRMLFRQHGDTWVITEPTEVELGAPITITRGQLLIESYTNYVYTDAVISVIEDAYTRVQRFFGSMPDQELRVVLKPAFGVGAIIPFDVQAYYEHGRRPQLMITVPWSVSFRPYDPDDGWQSIVSHLAAHELTHFVHQTDPRLASVNKAPGWVAEGLAEYVSTPLWLDLARPIHERDGWLPLEQADGVSLLSLDALSPKDRAIAYIQAQLLIAYLARDGQQQLWEFIAAYAEAPGTGAARLDTALHASLNSDLSSFINNWEKWVAAQLEAAPG